MGTFSNLSGVKLKDHECYQAWNQVIFKELSAETIRVTVTQEAQHVPSGCITLRPSPEGCALLQLWSPLSPTPWKAPLYFLPTVPASAVELPVSSPLGAPGSPAWKNRAPLGTLLRNQHSPTDCGKQSRSSHKPMKSRGSMF